MSSKVIFCSGFVCGAMVGAIGIWKYVENKYERIAQEEIDSVKNVYSKKGKPAGKPENQCDLASNMDKACQKILVYVYNMRYNAFNQFSYIKGGNDEKQKLEHRGSQ